MKNLKVVFSLLILSQWSFAQPLPQWNPSFEQAQVKDWLIQSPQQKAGVYATADGKDIILYNGLVKRSFRISPNLACIDFRNLSSGQQLLRAISP